jgi:iron complex outermembrane receptor protein
MFSGQEKTYQAWNYVLQDSLNAGNRTFNSCGMYYDANGNLKYYDNETDNYKQDNYQLHYIQTINSRLNLSLTGHYTAGKGYYEQYKQGQTLAAYKMPDVIRPNDTITTSDLIRRRWLDNDFVGVLGNINYNPLSKLSFVLGGGYNSYIGRHNGEVIWAQFADPDNFRPRYYDDKATKTDGNVYLKTTIRPSPKFTVFVDLQYRAINYSFTGFDTSRVNTAVQDASYGFFNPKLGLNYLLTPNTNVYASYGIANKEPNRNDFTQSTAQSRPKPEQLNDLEAGITHRFKHVNIGLNVYDMEYKNQLVLNGQINDVGAYNRVNVEYSYRRGVEAELSADLTKYFTFNGNLTLSQNKVKNFTEFIDSSDVNYTVFTQYKKNYSLTDISFSPNVIAAANLIFKPIKNLEIAVLNKYVGRQYLDNTSDVDRSIHDYLVTDLRVNYTIRTRLIKEINLIGVIYNISNTVYETNGYNYSFYSGNQLYKQNYLAPAAPTNFMLALNLRF